MRLWDATTGALVGQPMVSQDFITEAAFSPDGKTILSASVFGPARWWDVASTQQIGRPINIADSGATKSSTELMLRNNRIASVTLSPDVKTILTMNFAGKTTMWNAASGQLVMYPNDTNFAGFSPDGRTVLLASRDNKTVRMWDAATWRPVGKPMEHQESVASVLFSRDGKTILTWGGGSAMLWAATTAEPIGQLVVNERRDHPVAFGPKGKTILVRSVDATLRILDIATGKPVQRPMVHPSGSRISLDFSPDGMTILTGIRFSTSESRSGDGPDGYTYSAILTENSNSMARLWDATTGQPVGPMLPVQGGIVSLAYGPDGKTIVTASSGDEVAIERNPRPARLWHLPAMIDDDLSRIEAWVETLTALEVDDEGNIDVLDFDAWQNRRESLRKLGGPPPTDSNWLFDPILYGPDPTARARAWMERECWAEAEAAFAEVIRAWPLRRSALIERGRFYLMRSEPEKAVADFVRAVALGDRDSKLITDIAANDTVFDSVLVLLPADSVERSAELLLARGEHLATLGQWARATAAYRRALQLRPDNYQSRYHQILALLAIGDRDGLRQASSDLLDRFHDTTNSQTAGARSRAANTVAWSLALAPCIVSDTATPLRLADLAVNGFTADQKHIALNTLGAALYRAGRFEDAIRRLEEGIKLRNSEEEPGDWPFLAMAHHALGHRDESRRWLDQLRDHQPSADPNRFWHELEIRLLQSEAEAVVLYDPIFPADPFAH